uniref:Ketoreductase domain-containing protein n=1 Tax=Globisporangium ultimum (strain ATCC 200006 / CBS 805.95 / DAOM BR144) TaxID=431595 RepID=K3WIM3_GLOUD
MVSPHAVAALLLLLLLLLLLRSRLTASRFSLDDRVVLITGAGSGLGRALVQKFCGHAARVTLVLVDIDTRALERVRADLLQRKGKTDTNVLIYTCDVSDDKAVDACVKEIHKQIAPKRIDVLVNNAGIVSGKSLLELSAAQIRATFAVNTLAHFWMVRAVLPSMKQCKDGLIVSVSSVMGMASSAGLTDYCASKAAINGFHESLRLELQRDHLDHIRTLLVCPSAVDTGMFDGAFQGDSSSMRLARMIVPLLDEQDVVDCIYDAMLSGKKLLIYCSKGWRGRVIPWVASISRLLPVEWFDWLLSLAGGHHGMDKFVGRK